jgi:hypothetical protein
MFCLPVTDKILNAATERAGQIGKLKGSIRGGEGNVIGCLFEVAYKMLYRGEYSPRENRHNYDVTCSILGRVECKSKERTVNPIDTYDASIADGVGMGTNQECDHYAFGSVTVDGNKSPRTIWFCGWIPKAAYLRGKHLSGDRQSLTDARRYRGLKDGAERRVKGQVYDSNGFVCREDCWNRPYGYLSDLVLPKCVDHIRD